MSTEKVRKDTPVKFCLVVLFWMIVALVVCLTIPTLLSAPSTVKNCIGALLALVWIYSCVMVIPNHILSSLYKEVTVTPPKQ